MTLVCVQGSADVTQSNHDEQQKVFLILHKHTDSTFIFSLPIPECELWHEVKINLTLTTASL